MAEDLIPCEDEREKILLQAALKFVKHHRAGRVQCLTELASVIRLPPETIMQYHSFETPASPHSGLSGAFTFYPSESE